MGTSIAIRIEHCRSLQVPIPKGLEPEDKVHQRISDKVESAKKLQAEGKTIPEIASILEESPENVKKLLERHNLNVSTKPVKQHDWRELATHADEGRQFNEDSDITQRYALAEIDTDEPIAVVYTGDWHLGDRYADYDLWRKHIEAIMNDKRVYMIALGDENQNARAFKNLSMVLEQVLSPKLQVQLLNSLFDELIKDQKLIAKVLGNHDAEFDERIYGEKLVGFTEKMKEIPIFSNRGVIELKVGNEVYTNLLFHKSRFRSFMRPTHGAYREYQMSYPAEVVAGGHDHIPGIEIMHIRNSIGEANEIFLIKSGSFNDSDFGWKYFHNGGSLMPTVVYYPHQHKKLVFTELNDALRYME